MMMHPCTLISPVHLLTNLEGTDGSFKKGMPSKFDDIPFMVR